MLLWYIDNFHRQDDQALVPTQTKHRRGSNVDEILPLSISLLQLSHIWSWKIVGGTRIYSPHIENNSVNTEFVCSLMGPLLLAFVIIALAMLGLRG